MLLDVIKKIYCKGDLYSHFKGRVSLNDVQQVVYDVLKETRQLDLENARKVKLLRQNEVRAIMIELGEIEV
jgi:hypothetical protein